MAARTTIAGTRYTIRLTSATRGEAAPGAPSRATPNEAAGPGWIADVLFAAGRGRMDIVDGAAPPLFERGDRILFDSSDFIVMHPDAKDFVSMTADIAARDVTVAGSHPENALSFSDVMVRLDTIGPVDTVGGRHTERYTLSASYATSYALDLGVTPRKVLVRTTTDYWLAEGVSFSSNPFIHAGSSATLATAGFAGIAQQMTTAMAGIGRGAPLRTITVTRLTDATGATFETRQQVDITSIATVGVDPTSLTLPRDYTESPLPGRGPSTMSVDGGAKWRTPPAR